ncbi:alpha/beta hydrolase [Candidatus Sumerlaeota bacterium]|nr:alpha/beta hydrolase [Candidatus Sumerlaeota bacterium]
MKRRVLSPRLLPLVSILILWAIVPLRAEEGFFDSDGVKIHYIVEGQGEPVLLIHGFTANISMQWVMPGVFPALTKNFQVIAFDNRGHGKSDKPHEPGQYGIKMVEDAVHLLDHLKIKKAHIVGYSLGGFITMKFIATHPERIISAVPCGAGWGLPNDPKMNLMDELADSLDSGNGFTPLINYLTPADQPKPSEEKLKSLNTMMTSMNDVHALAACIRGNKTLTVTEEQLRANKVPTLAIIGSRDPIKAQLDRMVGVMSNLDVIIVDGADHMTCFSRPEYINGLTEFLQKHSATPKTAPAAPVAAGN